MKRVNKIFLLSLVAALFGINSRTNAQISLDSYYNIDWQFNIPLNNSFSNVASGWGMNFEGG